MPFYRWTTFQDLVALQDRMNRILEEAIRGGNLAPEGREPGHWVPTADVFETQEAFHLHVELPGVDRSDIDLETDADRIVLRGTRRPPENTTSESFIRMEGTYGPFKREFPIPADTIADATEANLENGVLVVRIPRRGSVARIVPVQRGS
jgi:HSP20 family protein